MRTCLGASLELTSPAQLPPGCLDALQLLHCEGYSLYRPHLTRHMMAAAKAAGSTVSLDLASFEVTVAGMPALVILSRLVTVFTCGPDITSCTRAAKPPQPTVAQLLLLRNYLSNCPVPPPACTQ